MKEKLPKVGQQVVTPLGKATVIGSNPLKETILVEMESQVVVEFPLQRISLEEEPARQPAQKKPKKRR
jgi:hypothetical protein